MPSRLRVPVEVPPDVEGAEDPDKLSIKINQIFLQKGPFRNVTEQSVALGPDNDESESENDSRSDKSDEETREERLELLSKTREELFEIVRRGTLQCNEALDFISLLLSKHSRAAESTFSPALKDAVKPGMLDGVYLDNARYAPTIRPKQDLAKGWRTRSFLSATERMHAASKRLKREADSQSSFWAQIAEMGNEGWKVCRHPANRRQIGVMFGMPEAAPQFRNQGFVTLQQDTESNIQLARRPIRKRVFVAISRSGEITGRHTAGDTTAEAKSALIRDLTEARDCLFDEELFYELGREARVAANQGIITRGEDIEFTISDQCSVRLSLQSASDTSQSTAQDTDLARFIGLSLRSLLIQAHHQNYLRRTRPPPPLSTKTFHTPEYAILRPLIAALRHSIGKAEFEKRVREDIITPLRRAGVNLDLKPESPQQHSKAAQSEQRSLISVEGHQDTYIIMFPDDRLTIRIVTYLDRPLYEIVYHDEDVDCSDFRSREEYWGAIRRVTLNYLVNFLVKYTHDNNMRWEAQYTFRNDLRFSPIGIDIPGGSDEDVIRIRHTLVDGEYTMRVSAPQLEQPVVKTWTSMKPQTTGKESEEHRTLLDTIRELLDEGYSHLKVVALAREEVARKAKGN